MSDNVENVILPILIKIQEDISAFEKTVGLRFDGMEAQFIGRFDRIDEIIGKQRRDTAGLLVMMKGTAGDFDGRVTRLERRVAELESELRKT